MTFLRSRLAWIVKDSRLLKPIRRYLEAEMVDEQGVMKRDRGMPQGGPMSPLLSNIPLDDLDKELELRGYSFCCNADDCNNYMSSHKAGKRALSNISKFFEITLRLQVNVQKSAVTRPWGRKFPGYSFTWHKETLLKIAQNSVEPLKDKIRSLTTGNGS